MLHVCISFIHHQHYLILAYDITHKSNTSLSPSRSLSEFKLIDLLNKLQMQIFSYLWFKAFNFKALPLMAQQSKQGKEKFTSGTMLN
jgi:hypothetical protein